MDFMGAVLIGIMSFFSTRSILFDISFFFRSISHINSGAKVIGAAIWFNLQWWMYMVVWAAFLDIGRVFILIYIIFLDLFKGGFFSESEISFSNLPISPKKYSKKLS